MILKAFRDPKDTSADPYRASVNGQVLTHIVNFAQVPRRFPSCAAALKAAQREAALRMAAA